LTIGYKAIHCLAKMI